MWTSEQEKETYLQLYFTTEVKGNMVVLMVISVLQAPETVLNTPCTMLLCSSIDRHRWELLKKGKWHS